MADKVALSPARIPDYRVRVAGAVGLAVTDLIESNRDDPNVVMQWMVAAFLLFNHDQLLVADIADVMAKSESGVRDARDYIERACVTIMPLRFISNERRQRMPLRAAKACPKPGCGALTSSHWCAAHSAQVEAARGNSAARGYDRRWRKRRRRWLMAHPTCPECARRGFGKAATDVDHLVPLSAGGADYESNCESKCHECHSAKTAREDGGLGHASRDRGGQIPTIGRALTRARARARVHRIHRGGGYECMRGRVAPAAFDLSEAHRGDGLAKGG